MNRKVLLSLVFCLSSAAVSAQPFLGPTPDRELVVLLAPTFLAVPGEAPPESFAAERASRSFEERGVIAPSLAVGDPVGLVPLLGHRAEGQRRARLLSEPESPEARLQNYVVLRYPPGTALDEVMEVLREQPGILHVERNLGFRLSATPNDRFFRSYTSGQPPQFYQWGSQAMQFESAWDYVKGHAYVGIIDTGIQVDHPELRAFPTLVEDPVTGTCSYGAGSFEGGGFRPHLSWDFWGEPGEHEDCNPDEQDPVLDFPPGHGTHVAGILGATTDNLDGVAGACWNCNLMITKATEGQNMEGPNTVDLGMVLTDGMESLDFLVRGGAQIVNMSWGVFSFLDCSNTSTSMSAFCQALTLADQRDVLLVAAAGNHLSDIEFPAKDPRVLSIGGIEFGGSFWDEGNGRGSNYTPGTFDTGENQDFVGPARGTISTFYEGFLGCNEVGFPSTPSGLGFCSGTSMAAPHVAGAAALLRTVDPLLSKDELREALRRHADRAGAWDQRFGWGLPDVGASVVEVLGKSAGEPLENRLTPLFMLYGTEVEAHLLTTVPQMAIAALLDEATPFNGVGSSSVPRYFEFPGVSCPVGCPPFAFPSASVYLFATDRAPAGAQELVPLYRTSRDRPLPNNPRNRSYYYTTQTSEIETQNAAGFHLDGIEGYLHPRCSPEPGCIPNGAVRLHRLYNPWRDDQVLVQESEVSAFQSSGYRSVGSSAWIGYAYPNQDSDFDDLIDGFELLAGTDPEMFDTDGDGLGDGLEVLSFPRTDPLDNLPPTAYGDVIPVPCGAASVSLAAVLANDFDPERDPLQLCPETSPRNGGLSVGETTAQYLPGPVFWSLGEDSFTYRASDRLCPGNSNVATVRLVSSCPSGPLIFGDGFESGDLSAWYGDYTPSSGQLAVTAAAALEGSYGLQVTLPGGGATHAFLVDETPLLVSHSRTTFLMDPSHLYLSEGDFLTLFAGMDVDHSYRSQLLLRQVQGQLQIKLLVYEDDRTRRAPSGWVTMARTTQAVGVELWAASAPGAADGGFRLSVDGVVRAQLLDLANHGAALKRTRLGAVGADPGTSGELYLDAYTFRSGEHARTPVFGDGFEGQDLSSWWAQWAPGANSLSAASSAALQGQFGLQVDLNDDAAPAFLVDESAGGSDSLLVTFRLDPNGVGLPTGNQAMALLAVLNQELAYRLQLRFRYETWGYQLKLDAWEDDSTFASAPSWVTLSGGPQLLAIELVAASSPGADDGRARLWIDGSLAAEVAGLDNDQLSIRRVRFGGISVKAGMTGTLKLDSYSSFLAAP